MQQYTGQDLDDLAQGACILASGGGGPIIMKQPLLELLAKEPAPQIASINEVGDNDQVIVLAGIGMPSSVTTQTLAPLADAVTDAIEAAQQAGKIAFVAIGEIGIANTLLPILACARRKIPVLDVAGGRRSIPSFKMCSYARLPISPVFLASTQKALFILNVKDTGAAERNTMQLVGASQGEMFGIAFWPMTGKVIRTVGNHGALEYTRKLGEALRQSIGADPVQAVTKYLGGETLFQGQISAFQQRASGGFDVNITVFANGTTTEKFSVYSVNESLMAWSSISVSPVAMGPDLICYLTTQGAVFTNADAAGIRAKKQEVAIIGVPAPPELATPAMIDAFLEGLRQLGYGGPYVPLHILKGLRKGPPVAPVKEPTDGPLPDVPRWKTQTA